MSEWTAKRFWTETRVVAADSGFTVELDTRPVKTPAKNLLVVPTHTMAEEISVEWDAQVEVIDPTTMPFTRSANAAIDKVRVQHAEVADMLAGYGDSDLLCYRADGPEGLIARQKTQWDPLLDWAADVLGARLLPVEGVIHHPQAEAALTALSERTHALSDFELSAFHDLVSLTGSLILGFATAYDHLAPKEAWAISRVDEIWQQEQWGVDEEAAELAEIKQAGFLIAKRFFDAACA